MRVDYLWLSLLSHNSSIFQAVSIFCRFGHTLWSGPLTLQVRSLSEIFKGSIMLCHIFSHRLVWLRVFVSSQILGPPHMGLQDAAVCQTSTYEAKKTPITNKAWRLKSASYTSIRVTKAHIARKILPLSLISMWSIEHLHWLYSKLSEKYKSGPIFTYLL